MTNLTKYIKKSFSMLIIWSLFSITFAANTSQQWRDILNQLRADWRSDKEIKNKMEDLWLDTSGYFPSNSTISSTTNSTTNSSTTSHSSSNSTSQQWRDTLNKLRADWRSDKEIKNKMEDLWLDTSGYFPESNNSTNNSTTQEWWDIINELRDDWWKDSEIKIIIKDLWLDVNSYFQSSSNSSSSSSNNGSTYTSRSCKTYTIKYMDNLWVYTSPDLKKTEYFINTDYFKRYIDSKNPQKSGCPVNGWYISAFYTDNSNNSDRYIAPNWKVYFISNQNWSYTSNELGTSKRFSTINELKNYIRDRNPLVWMWENTQSNNQNNNQQNNKNNANNNSNSLTTIWNEIFN